MGNRERAVVVGGGFGGLAGAIRLRAQGYDVTLVEATDQLGGRGSVFKQDGFTFDAGPTVITAPYLFEELFDLVGANMDDYFTLQPVDPFYRVVFPEGEIFDYVGDEERLLEQIGKFNKADVDGYKKMANHAREIFEKGYLELADQPFSRVSDMLRVAPTMVKLQNYRSVYGLVSKYIRDPRLRQVFTFEPLLVGGNPFNVSSIYMLIHWLERKWGVHYAVGGTGAIVAGMQRLLRELEVDIRLSSPVDEIVVEGGKATGVVLESGEKIAANVVVANADPSTVYKNLIPASARKKHTDRRIDKMRQSMSLYVIYFGTKKTYEDLAHHTIYLGPRYKELLHDVFEKKVLADDFSLYLHAPTRSDASMAPPGHECFYVLSPVPNQESGLNWEDHNKEYCDRILSYLDKNHVPGLQENLVTCKTVDPRYFEGPMRSLKGAAFGPEPRLTQSAWFRYHNESEDVGGLYFVGAGTHPGAGVPGVLNSAKVLDRVVPAVEGAGKITVDKLKRRVA